MTTSSSKSTLELFISLIQPADLILRMGMASQASKPPTYSPVDSGYLRQRSPLEHIHVGLRPWEPPGVA